MANDAVKNITKLIFTKAGDFLINFIKSFLQILKNNNKYIRFSTEVIIPNKFGASKNKGLNQKVNNFRGKG